MARPQSISREQILEAAREIFFKEGINASTASIAKCAGVSEGLIFKRFSTKEALFREAMGLPDLRIRDELQTLLDVDDVEAGLEAVVLRLVQLFREFLPRMMMLWANCASPEQSPIQIMMKAKETGGQPLPLLLLRTLSAVLEEHQRAGRLRDLDPEIIARVMLGSSHNFAFFEITGIHVRQPLAATSFARGVVDLIMNGASAPERPL